MKYEAVIFDMDGVIFDSERLVLKGWKEIAAKYNMSKESVYSDLRISEERLTALVFGVDGLRAH